MTITGQKQNEAYKEFSSTGNVFPSGTKTLREFWNGNGVANVCNCSWQASNGCMVYFTMTVRRRQHSRQVTLIAE